MPDRPMIEIAGVSRNFGTFRALDDINLTIAEGQFFSLLGPSGCGKTTLLRLLAGLDVPSAGTIRIDGEDCTEIRANARPTNMVFQSYAIFPHLNVAENVGYGLKRLRLGRAEEDRRVAEALEMVRLPDFGRRKGNELSGGQRQRVALARALVMRPKVLLLDEPLSALDKKLREEMQIELRSLQQSVGITFVLVTHDQYEALALSDRIAVMFAGRVAQVAEPMEIYQHPATRQVADFLGGMNFLSARIAGETGETLTVETDRLGTAVLRKPAGFTASGNRATVGIRPERLRVLWDDETAPHMLTGRIASRAYFGETTSLAVAIEGLDAPLSIVETNDYGADELKIGAEIRLAYDPEALVLVSDPAA
ncbi:ABC transporter ATP-binding protein [Solirhodobacter olei]|uniref:ABC transporter ATP-binding protein n=1 Tax=Solirhodobacter olei TaxID=2493082 RepID=UPI001F4E4296|nr:ABC transporter ATP-binding protein [Solirhodobacter olei]